MRLFLFVVENCAILLEVSNILLMEFYGNLPNAE